MADYPFHHPSLHGMTDAQLERVVGDILYDEVTHTSTGKARDPYDGRPMFDIDDEGQPRSRRRHLDETKQDRKAAFVEALRTPIEPDAPDDVEDGDPDDEARGSA
jgi:hypothetical protein